MSIVLVGSTSGSITLQEPAVAGSTVLDLPATSGTILTSASAISASSITTGTLPKAQLPTGSVLQVIQTVKTDTFSTTSTSFVDITGLSVSITPTSSSSKILVIANLQIQTTATSTIGCRLVRGATAIFVGDAAGSRPQASAVTNVQSNYNWSGQSSMTFLDSPATTSATTYKVQIYEGQGNTGYVGRTFDDQNSNSSGRVPCQITVMEIAA